MIEVLEGSTLGLPDVEGFLDLVDAPERAHPEARGLFPERAEIVVARAPGRLDVMGGIADYSGSLVLELPLAEATLVALARSAERRLRVVSLADGAQSRSTSFEIALEALEEGGAPLGYEAARALFARAERQAWGAYVAGVFLVLMRERRVRFPGGARLLVSSRVPEGKGVASSAALEVAVLHAAAAAFRISVAPRDAALLCQTAENQVVGAPCGVMDQMTATAGEAGRLLALRCRPAELEGTIEVPGEIAFWGIDSGRSHAVSGSDYGSVRVGAFMGRRILAELAGAGSVPPWGEFLANLSPSVFRERYAARLPERILGSEFLARYGPTGDTATRVEREKAYAVRTPTAHPIEENFRVEAFAALLGRRSETAREAMGELMYQSHASYSSCGLGSERTDLLVRLVREAGPGAGLYGAKITGGGSGGTVAILARRDAGGAVARVAELYRGETGHAPTIFAGSSPGAARFGHLRLRRVPA
jgi:L-arabinokinase